MCRILSYLGDPLLVGELLYKPDNSFIKQTYHPLYINLLNLAGFGMVAWDHTSNEYRLPYIYKTTKLPFYDENLKRLAEKIKPHCLLSHIRGLSISDAQVISDQNVHPFIFPDSTVALAHNGVLMNFVEMKYSLLPYIKPEFQKHIHGTTDSEWIYAVFLSQLAHPSGNFSTDEITKAILETLKIIQHVRNKHDIKINSPVNLFISNGDFIAVTRFVFDFGWQPLGAPTSAHFSYHSLWYTYGERYGLYEGEYKMRSNGKRSSIIIASEPLTEDSTTWVEVPEYTMLIARVEKDEISIVSKDINL